MRGETIPRPRRVGARDTGHLLGISDNCGNFDLSIDLLLLQLIGITKVILAYDYLYFPIIDVREVRLKLLDLRSTVLPIDIVLGICVLLQIGQQREECFVQSVESSL